MVALTSDTLPKLRQFTSQVNILHKKTNFATIVKDRSVLELFQLSNGELFFFLACLQHPQTLFHVRNLKIAEFNIAEAN